MVQWAMKGMSLRDEDQAREILWPRGLVCNWGRAARGIPVDKISERLTPESIRTHVDGFSTIDPLTKKKFFEESPYISLSSGTVERDSVNRANHIYTARRTAMQFGSRFGESDTAYIFTCWVLVAPRMAAEIYGVAEEVRNLTVYPSYSDFADQGEIAAKLHIPANQIERCEKWVRKAPREAYEPAWVVKNEGRFIPPERLSSVRDLL
ncbi:hypothetical protein ACFPBZ_15025 [Actinomycetospora atypica]|uniref:Uncharacterized protein n=2 Tax=Actinomycetospora atypica TaxID=1290095 RepID=A0ABV9YP84_9PSEU